MIDRFTSRERQIAVVALAIGFSIGMWVGLWSIPVESLSVPTSVDPGGTLEPAFYPVTSAYFAGPFIALLAAGWVVRHERLPDDRPELAQTATDGGEPDE